MACMVKIWLAYIQNNNIYIMQFLELLYKLCNVTNLVILPSSNIIGNKNQQNLRSDYFLVIYNFKLLLSKMFSYCIIKSTKYIF